MSQKHGLLGLLNYEPMTGYALDKLFRESLAFFWHAKASQIYRELDAMEQSGWLTSERVIQDDKPNKRVYSLTAQGKDEFLNWLASPENDILNAMQVKNAFLLRLFFAGEHTKEQALSMLNAYRDVCLKYLSKLDEAIEIAAEEEQSSPPEKAIFWNLTAMLGEAISQARLDWVNKAIKMLENID